MDSVLSKLANNFDSPTVPSNALRKEHVHMEQHSNQNDLFESPTVLKCFFSAWGPSAAVAEYTAVAARGSSSGARSELGVVDPVAGATVTWALVILLSFGAIGSGRGIDLLVYGIQVYREYGSL